MSETIIPVSDTQRIVVKGRRSKEFYPQELSKGWFVTKWRPAGWRQVLSLGCPQEPLYLFTEHEARLWLEWGENYHRHIDENELMKEMDREEAEHKADIARRRAERHLT